MYICVHMCLCVSRLLSVSLCVHVCVCLYICLCFHISFHSAAAEVDPPAQLPGARILSLHHHAQLLKEITLLQVIFTT